MIASERAGKNVYVQHDESDAMQVGRRSSSTRHNRMWASCCTAPYGMYTFTQIICAPSSNTNACRRCLCASVFISLCMCAPIEHVCMYEPSAVNRRINKLLQAASKPTDQWQIGKAVSGKCTYTQMIRRPKCAWTIKMHVCEYVAIASACCCCCRCFLFALFHILLLLHQRLRCFSLLFR